MIEVEKKFSLNKEQEENLKKGATFVSKEEFVDKYYDDKDFSITSQDNWFRERDGKFELKACKERNLDRKADQYEELTEEGEIRDFLGLKKQGSLSEDLKRAGYSPFCAIKTVRLRYKNDPFVIDIDEATAKDFFYCVAEIELMVEDKSGIEGAIEKIIKFAKSKGLDPNKYARGKVLEHMRQKRPKHFEFLVKVGAVK